jgi:hypothetical protein
MIKKVKSNRKVESIRKEVMSSIISVKKDIVEVDRVLKGDEKILDLLENDMNKVKQFLSLLEAKFDIHIPSDTENFLQDNNTIYDLYQYFVRELMVREGIDEVNHKQESERENMTFLRFLLKSPWYLIKYIFLMVWWVIKLPFRLVGWILKQRFFVVWWND